MGLQLHQQCLSPGESVGSGRAALTMPSPPTGVAPRANAVAEIRQGITNSLQGWPVDLSSPHTQDLISIAAHLGVTLAKQTGESPSQFFLTFLNEALAHNVSPKAFASLERSLPVLLKLWGTQGAAACYGYNFLRILVQNKDDSTAALRKIDILHSFLDRCAELASSAKINIRPSLIEAEIEVGDSPEELEQKLAALLSSRGA